ncbi:hypothetical protein HPB51_008159 [Rhipicephalus microplus]|uniref:Transposable element n=1 Tax=Rhipicephalus microplus TaxID=6941 RepID=A0A9J6D4I4_RHIMP|nr:hypothetical protein HPB51_008159 [Rhipicephalus microplus]
MLNARARDFVSGKITDKALKWFLGHTGHIAASPASCGESNCSNANGSRHVRASRPSTTSAPASSRSNLPVAMQEELPVLLGWTLAVDRQGSLAPAPPLLRQPKLGVWYQGSKVRDQSTRETPDAKRSRQEASQLARAVEESLASYEAEQERDRFSSLEELRARLQGVSVSPKQTVIHKKECSMFLNTIDYREPCLNASLTVFANLEVFACYQGSPIKNLGSAVVPDSVQKVSSLLEILNNLSMLSGERCTYRHLAQAIHFLLDKLEASIDESKKETVNFMKEQLHLLSAKRIQYSAQVFNPPVPEALAARKGHTDFQHATATAEFIKMILRWWSIVNVKTPSKGFHHRNVYEEPMSNHTDDPKASFLSAFITWLDVWESYRHDTGVLTQETLSALRLSAQSLLALVKCCVSELYFKYILLGKVQTDPLESRFGQYRQMAGGQYHISVHQLCETEGRIRLQNALPRMSNDDLRGIKETDSVRDAGTSLSVHVSDADLDELRAQMPVIGYVGGYCAHAAMKVLKCESCQRQLFVSGNTAEPGEDTHSLIAQLDRDGLKFPSALVIAVDMYTEVVVRKLMTESTSTQFLQGPNQKNVVRQLTLDSLPRLEDIDTCENGHTYELLITLVANCAANIMLNNLCKQRNDLLRIEKRSEGEK